MVCFGGQVAIVADIGDRYRYDQSLGVELRDAALKTKF